MMSSRYKLLATFVAATLLGGCATPTMYKWGGYDALLYQSYKSPEKADAMRLGLESHVTSLENAKERVAPGIYAEIGSLYLQGGDTRKALIFYARERDAWPESRELMDALIRNTSKRGPADSIRSEGKK